MRQSKNRVLFKDGLPMAWAAVCKKLTPDEPDRWVVMQIPSNPFADLTKVRRRVYGEADIMAYIQQNELSEESSFYTINTVKSGDVVQVTFTHSCVEGWNYVLEVPFGVDWQDHVLTKHRDICRANYRETHILNLRDLSV